MLENEVENTNIRRKKVLNVIYFIDAHKTKSFRISVKAFGLLVVFLSLLIMWSIGSGIIIFSKVKEENKLLSKLQNSLAIIFDYQIKYDNVYEGAYPTNGELITQKQEGPLVEAKIDKEVKPTKNENLVAEDNDKQSAPKLELKPKEQKEIKKEPALTNELAIIQDTKYKIVNNKLILDFSLKNKYSPKRADGYVFGVAHFVTDNGQIKYIGAPSGISLNETGEATNPRAAYRYSIRFFKAKRLEFVVEDTLKGHFSNIILSVINYNNDKQKSYNILINAKTDDPVEKVKTAATNEQD